jgi:hypothetical protein
MRGRLCGPCLTFSTPYYFIIVQRLLHNFAKILNSPSAPPFPHNKSFTEVNFADYLCENKWYIKNSLGFSRQAAEPGRLPAGPRGNHRHCAGHTFPHTQEADFLPSALQATARQIFGHNHNVVPCRQCSGSVNISYGSGFGSYQDISVAI